METRIRELVFYVPRSNTLYTVATKWKKGFKVINIFNDIIYLGEL